MGTHDDGETRSSMLLILTSPPDPVPWLPRLLELLVAGEVRCWLCEVIIADSLWLAYKPHVHAHTMMRKKKRVNTVERKVKLNIYPTSFLTGRARVVSQASSFLLVTRERKRVGQIPIADSFYCPHLLGQSCIIMSQNITMLTVQERVCYGNLTRLPLLLNIKLELACEP